MGEKELRKRTEVELGRLGYSADFLVERTGSYDYVIKQDLHGNTLYIGPTGRMVIHSPDGIICTHNLFCLTFLDGTKCPDYTVEKVLSSGPDDFFVELDRWDLQGLKSKEPENRTAPQPPSEYAPQPIPQSVDSLENLMEKSPKVGEALAGFLAEAKENLGPAYQISESGRWFVIGKNDLYKSEVFTSNCFAQISARDAMPKLVATVTAALAVENEEDLNRLILVHTHPIDSPLSNSDITTIHELSEMVGIEKGDSMEVMAIPVAKEGEVIYRYCIEK